MIYVLIIESCNGLFLQSLKFSGVIREEKSAETIFMPWDITTEISDIDEIKSLCESIPLSFSLIRMCDCLLLITKSITKKPQKKTNVQLDFDRQKPHVIRLIG